MHGAKSDYPSWAVQQLPTFSTLQLDLGNLYFFLTTNLLLPSRKVISIDTDAGLRIPRDFYIVGSIVPFSA